MAITAASVWDVKTTGSSTNGGAHCPGVGTKGVNGATDLAVDASVATKVTSVTHSFVSGDAMKWLQVTAGTGWLVGYYQILSVASGSATLDRSPAPVGTTAGTYSLYDGVDYSQQTSAQVTFNGTTITASNGGAGATITLSGYTVALGDQGNILNITGGTNFTTGRYEITSVSTGSNTWTLDRNCTTGAGAAMTGAMGGCLDGITTLASAMVSSSHAFVQTGTYAQSTVTFSQTGVTPSATVPYSHISGYVTVHGDITPYTNNQSSRPQVLTTGLNTNVLVFSNSGWFVENLIIGPSVVATMGTGIAFSGASCTAQNCKFTAYSSHAVQPGASNTSVVACELTGGTGGSGLNPTSGGTIALNWIHDNVGIGIAVTTGSQPVFVFANLVTNNSGANSDGIIFSSTGEFVCIYNTVYHSGRDGIRLSTTMAGAIVQNNLLSENVGYGLNQATAAWPAGWGTDGNFYYVGGGTGTRNNLDDTGNTNIVDGAGPYPNTRDVVLSGDPFIAKASNDFRLNGIPGAGAAVRGVGLPAFWPGNALTLGYPDGGAVQSQPYPGPIYNPGMSGGMTG